MSVSKGIQRLKNSLAIVTLSSLLVSCASLGPQTIERDRMDYGMSVRNSVKEQLLANIVGLRYMEAPVFVDVSSVINQYSLSGNVQAGVGFKTHLPVVIPGPSEREAGGKTARRLPTRLSAVRNFLKAC